ncbi:hypothetical protein C7999DRAFT_13447 [Corynascus novoguineensis]|uniref:BZIP domain-containing protein n=1 Tax=Corynascus novoguineensis TaxID=1126955 RepID=A0AAN7CVD6_9PEZI|nr:hypothetical protein C7999DRAFT_13447 [Corynascus novoguineensis]
MSSYGTGRVNVSQYLRNLNVQGPSVEETFTDEDLEKDLALFTNTQFFDFETGQHTDYQAPPAKPTAGQSPTEDVTPTESIMGDFPAGYEFPITDWLDRQLSYFFPVPPADHGTMSPGDFSFGDYSSTFTSPTVPAFPDTLGNHLQPVQPNPQPAYPAQVPHQQHHQQPSGYVPPSPAGATIVGGGVQKRKAESISGHAHAPNGRVLSFEEASRLAAEEDKRKRNTAASARFRIKKKQREQALEKSAKEMSEKVTMLEGRISALETENKWLKSLVTEKHGGREEILEKLLKEMAASQESSRDGAKDSISVASEETKKKD